MSSMRDYDLSALANIGGILRELRRAQRKTQREVADALGITTQSYQAYEAGKTLPTLENFLRLCLFLDVSPNAWLGVSDY